MAYLRSILFVASLAAITFFAGCGSDDNVATVFNAQEQLEEDVALIDDYLTERGYEADTTGLQVRISVFESGEGQLAEEGDLVSLDYVGRFLSRNSDDEIIDTVFFDATILSVYQEKIDENVTDNPVRFRPFNYSYSSNGWTLTSASGGVDFVVGFRNGITELFKKIGKGGRAEIIIPSGVAYGEFGRRPGIPPNQVLIFEIFLRDIER